MRNQYDYDDPEEGMQEAVERARQQYATAADGNPVAYDPADQPTPDPAEGLPPAESRDFSENDEALSLLETQAPSGNVRPTETPAQRKAAEFAEEGAQPPRPKYDPNAEYEAAMKRLTGVPSRPVPDASRGLAKAQQQDRGQNRIERIMALISAGVREAPPPSFPSMATNASGFMQQQTLANQARQSELTGAGLAARVAKPSGRAGAGGGNVDALRSYLVKVGAGTDAELAGMSETQLRAVMSAYGLKSRTDTHAAERIKDEDYRERSLKQRKEDTAASRALAARGLEDREKNQIADDAQKLAGDLGDTAVFEQRYARLKQLAEENGGQLPGLGVIEGVRQQPGAIGSAVRAVSPPKPAAVEGRKLLRQLAADYARAISGAGVSDRERSVLNAATVDVDNDDSSIAMAGLESLREMYETKAAQLKRGFRPEAVRQVGGTVRVRFPNGSEADVPEAEVEEAVHKFKGQVVK